MSTIADVTHALRSVLSDHADRLAQANRFVRRRDKPLTGALFVQTLVLTLLAQPRASLTDYCHTAAARGRLLSPQAFDQNFTEPAADLLRAVLQLSAAVAITAADPITAGLLSRFSAVLLFDCCSIGLPASLAALWTGCGNDRRPVGTAATLKLALGRALLRGQVRGLELLDGCVPDPLSRVPTTPLPPHAVRLADLGFFSLARFAAVEAAAGYWFSRIRTDVLVVTAAGGRGTVAEVLATQAGGEVDEWVTLGAEAQVRARLIAVRVSQEVADNRRRQLRAAAREQGRAVSARRLASAGWNTYVCNIEAAQLSVQEAVVLAGVRWQIELLFKGWKSHGQIDEWADTGNRWRVLSEVYAKLIGQVVSHWVVVVSCWGDPARSLAQAAAVVRQYGGALVSSWGDDEQLGRALEVIKQVIRTSCHMSKRRKQPSTYQLLLNPELLANTRALA